MRKVFFAVGCVGRRARRSLTPCEARALCRSALADRNWGGGRSWGVGGAGARSPEHPTLRHLEALRPLTLTKLQITLRRLKLGAQNPALLTLTKFRACESSALLAGADEKSFAFLDAARATRRAR